MTAAEIISEIKSMANEPAKKMYLKHGAKEPFYAVKIEDLKKIQKKIKKDYQLALELYNSGIADARYLAGLIADETKMKEKDLRKWANNSTWSMHSEYTVPWVASESKFGWDLGIEWIDSKKELIASTGWATLANLVTLKKDEDLDIAKLKSLLSRVEKEIHNAPNRVRYTMNSFVISLGAYVAILSEEAIKAGKKIGIVNVDMGATACKVPFAPEYIVKAKARNTTWKKKKTVRC